jgi:hypothetical protein
MTEPKPTYQPKPADLQEVDLLALRADLIKLTIRVERVLEAQGRPVQSATGNRQARRNLTRRSR